MIKMMKFNTHFIDRFMKNTQIFPSVRKEIAEGADWSLCQVIAMDKQTEENHPRFQKLIMEERGRGQGFTANSKLFTLWKADLVKYM